MMSEVLPPGSVIVFVTNNGASVFDGSTDLYSADDLVKMVRSHSNYDVFADMEVTEAGDGDIEPTMRAMFFKIFTDEDDTGYDSEATVDWDEEDKSRF